MSRGATVVVKCKRCREPFSARVADRKRGWGKFCSKSCKAIKQTQKRGWLGPRDLTIFDEVDESWDSHKGY